VALEKPLDAISAEDVQGLITAAIPEGTTLEFKSALPGRSSDDGREFLADVTSFANTAGGHLLFGIVEKEGVAATVSAIEGVSWDDEILRLEAMIRDGVEPRLTGVRMRVIPVDKGSVLVVRILRAWNPPHRVVAYKDNRFFGRNSRGKYPLDVPELRRVFSAGEAFHERVQGFRANRIHMLLAGEGPAKLPVGGNRVMHLVPFGAFSGEDRIAGAWMAERWHELSPLEGAACDRRFNFDGFLSCEVEYGGQPTGRYLQLFRSGTVEVVGNEYLAPQRGSLLINPDFEEVVMTQALRFLNLQREGGVDPPIVILLTFVGMKGYSPMLGPGGHPIDRPILALPEVLIQDYDSDVAALLRPAFDVIWQAMGVRGSPHYGPDGKRRPRSSR
jgi:hypothetical protein